MADILIKNIELKGSLLLTPKAIFKPVEGHDHEKIVQKWEIVKEAEIVPVPEHGRVIEAHFDYAEFKKRYEEAFGYNFDFFDLYNAFSIFNDMIVNAPTVLEASK